MSVEQLRTVSTNDSYRKIEKPKNLGEIGQQPELIAYCASKDRREIAPTAAAKLNKESEGYL